MIDKPELDKRKSFILATVVYEYINTAEPVGSVTLTQKYNLGVSSATIRNELAELEAGGYLVQPHTSAGRIPSDAGYRTYVDRLMQPEVLTKDDTRRIRDQFREASNELADVIEQTTRLLSGLSGNLAIAVAPSRDTHAFKHVQLLWLSARTSMVVVVTSGGVAAQRVVEWTSDVAADDLTRLSNALNSRLGGRIMEDVTVAQLDTICSELSAPTEIRDAVRMAFAQARQTEEPDLAASGAQNLLDQPEFHDLRKLRAILRIVEEQRTLYDLIADELTHEAPAAQPTPHVRIGHELGPDELSECSVVTVPYRFGDRGVGVLAILGPRRMPYARLMALASGTARSLGDHLNDVEIR
ncbi:heat-inducible transcription repressor HrcA [Vulcanimicrobium alpinum]|uniref:Heat-inducible transcription repressor HrcA n=1 Tax=Vulcanimicrobium alpinum TaxID=3016050 RepID=A0AAN1XYG7_UNVUL|nr:heat-inducible transcriptional repressor HrcA [Vulcanimicrobium alpinum]BDE06966.1 heat-inducible transcription repressor HrcA [Vulcanimicrobium alpinum]